MPNHPKFFNKNTASPAPGTREVLVSWSVPIRGGVLACFNPWWPNLFFAMA
jgi:hypothetical protein